MKWKITSQMYKNAVPYPNGQVAAEEMFHLGVIPSDTDFRIFRDYGHIPGGCVCMHTVCECLIDVILTFTVCFVFQSAQEWILLMY